MTARKIEKLTDAKVFVPKIITRIIPRNRKSRIIVESAKPLYPGYLFIDRKTTRWLDFLDIPYVTHIFRRTQWEPYYIDGKKITMEMRRQEEEFNFKVGDWVYITQGPFCDKRARVVEGEKVKINMFGRPLVVSILPSMLTKTPS